VTIKDGVKSSAVYEPVPHGGAPASF
jgi:hypothetical protein